MPMRQDGFSHLSEWKPPCLPARSRFCLTVNSAALLQALSDISLAMHAPLFPIGTKRSDQALAD